MDTSDAGDTAEDVDSDAPCVPNEGGACMLRDGDESLSTLDDDDDDPNTVRQSGTDDPRNSSVQLTFDTTTADAAEKFWDPSTDLTQHVQKALREDPSRGGGNNPSAAAAEAAATGFVTTRMDALVAQYATPVQAKLWEAASREERQQWVAVLAWRSVSSE